MFNLILKFLLALILLAGLETLLRCRILSIHRQFDQDKTTFKVIGKWTFYVLLVAKPIRQWKQFYWKRWEPKPPRIVAIQTPWFSITVSDRPITLTQVEKR